MLQLLTLSCIGLYSFYFSYQRSQYFRSVRCFKCLFFAHYILQLFFQSVVYRFCIFICKLPALVTIGTDGVTQILAAKVLNVLKAGLFFALSPRLLVKRVYLRVQGFGLWKNKAQGIWVQ